MALKGVKPDWDHESDNEAGMYHRLRPLQGTVVPVFYGVATGCGEEEEEEEEKGRALVALRRGGDGSWVACRMPSAAARS